ncbi:hypothetical protein CVU82_03535 [Candidatus Falkowbacteria bacterium HGW-Falkowbacteria-1]|jgi:hypothetical protein|uniref:Uncharacterized protein n=1 Tax=Candidatus Falkowbacteria bacterium HGW-Falkowbacteria-1 TaxID=2013768 RepID=A0A2N2E8W1_9BACT|nr:MAG: hypothetical protein CVU82_03535 [Candidatus Falkowbacteria bacterium HGW-Falkowbacteria-1]
MQNKKSILKIFLTLFIFSFLVIPFLVFAQSSSNPVEFTPQVTIPGSSFIKGTTYTIKESTSSIAEYVKAIYNYLLSIVGITAAIVLMVGGVIWLTSGGSSEKVTQAKSWIGGSLTGLTLALLSYIILQTINPQLVSFTPTDIPKIRPIKTGCCQYQTLGATRSTAEQTTDVECYRIHLEKADPKIASITNEELNKSPYNGELSIYLGDDRFNAKKRANYADGICEETGYCEIYDDDFANLNISERRDSTVVTQMSLRQCGALNNKPNEASWATGKIIARFYSEEQFKQENMAIYRTAFQKTCENREGGSCNNSGSLYCYCYGGVAYVNEGLKNEPCGNDGGKCIPDLDIPGTNLPSDEDEFCENQDMGSRGCSDSPKSLICCEPGGVWGGYNPGLTY